MAGRRLLVRKVSEATYRRIREAAERSGGSARTVLFEPFAVAYPQSPLEAIEELRHRAQAEGVSFESLVRRLNPGAVELSSVPEGERMHSVPVLGVQDDEYEAWRVSLARDGRPAPAVLEEMLERAAPFTPGDVVRAVFPSDRGRRWGR